MKNKAFTLAEVLITLGIIGVVAAMTIPSLMSTIKNKVQNIRISIMEKKLIEGLNLFNSQDNGLSRSYESTEKFLVGLSKHMKILQICGKDELDKCFPYQEINYMRNGQQQQISISNLKTAASLHLTSDFLPPAAFIMGNGVSFIISYDNTCSEDSDKPLKEITTCIDGIYDISGGNKPNRYGDDIRPLLSAIFDGACVNEINGVCLKSAPFYPSSGLNYEQCKEYFGINNCAPADSFVMTHGGDYWSSAKKTCEERGLFLPSHEDLDKIASKLYGKNIASEGKEENITLNQELAASYGFKNPEGRSSYFYLWSNEDYTVHYANLRQFSTYNTKFYCSAEDGITRADQGVQAVCVGN